MEFLDLQNFLAWGLESFFYNFTRYIVPTLLTIISENSENWNSAQILVSEEFLEASWTQASKLFLYLQQQQMTHMGGDLKLTLFWEEAYEHITSQSGQQR